MQVPVAGGTAIPLVTYASGSSVHPWGLAQHAGSVYWTDDASMGEVFKGTSTILPNPEASPAAMAVDDASNLYWVASGGIRCLPSGSGTPFTLSSTGSTGGIAVDTSNVYWISGAGPTGAVNSTPIDGQVGSGTVKPLWSSVSYPLAPLTVDSSFVYFAGGEVTPFALQKVPIAGGSPVTLASIDTPQYFATDSANIYWTTTTAVEACPLPSCAGGPVTVASNRNNPTVIATDSSAIYWVENGLVMKVTK